MTTPQAPQQGPQQNVPPTSAYPQQGQVPPQWTPPPGWGQAPPPPAPKKRRRWPWIVGGIVLLIIIINMANGGADTPATPVAAAPTAAPVPAATVPQADEPAAPAAQEPSGYGKESGKYGDEIVAGDMAVTANAPKVTSQEFIGDQTCATVSLRNTGDSPQAFSPFDWKFRTGEGVETSASIPFNAGKALNTGELAPGGKTSGQVCGDTNTSGVTSLVYSPGFGIMHEVVWSK